MKLLISLASALFGVPENISGRYDGPISGFILASSSVPVNSKVKIDLFTDGTLTGTTEDGCTLAGKLEDDGSQPGQRSYQYKGTVTLTACKATDYNRSNYTAQFQSGGFVTLTLKTGNADGDAQLSSTITRTGPVGTALPVPETPTIGEYTGLWNVATESGWGLSLTQGKEPTRTPFVTLYVYQGSTPTWFVMSSGVWNDAKTGFTGDLYSTVGIDFAEATFDSTKVVNTKRGTLTMQFSSTSAGTLTYTVLVDGVTKTITKNVTKLVF
jgi:hypothetical protein